MKLACGVLLAKKLGKPSPDDLAPLVEELEATLDVGSHRLRHKDNASPDHEWEEAHT